MAYSNSDGLLQLLKYRCGGDWTKNTQSVHMVLKSLLGLGNSVSNLRRFHKMELWASPSGHVILN